MNPKNDAIDDGDVVFIDDSNSVVTGPRPARESVRKAIRERLEKGKKLLELKEKMYGTRTDGKNGDQPDSDLKRLG